MKFLIVFALAILACVNADCGCLKCSKHLTVAGEINGAPGHKPIKVIYRCQNGAGGCPHYPGALPIAVQKPVSIPDVPACGGGNEYSYGMQAFYNNPNLVSNYRGTYDNSHQGFSHGFTNGVSHRPYGAHETADEYGHGTGHGNSLASGYAGGSFADSVGIHPITVQKPIPVPERVTNCVPMSGLRASIDRVVMPSNPFPEFRQLIDSTDRYNPVYKDCPQLLRQRERCNPKPSCSCAPAPIIQLLHKDRYEYQGDSVIVTSRVGVSKHGGAKSHVRRKRQVPFLDHGYKFMMNMLPPFIKDPIKNAVNIMALTHPDKKLQKMYNQPPPQTLHEKLLEQHKKNVANLKEKLLGSTLQTNKQKKYSFDDYSLKKEASNFLDSLQELPTKSEKSRIPGLKMRSPSSDEEKDNNLWLREMVVRDILDHDLKSNLYSSEETGDGSSMTRAEKLLFKLKLKKLNEHRRGKRNVSLQNNVHTSSEDRRKKRSIIIDSEEFSLPLYQIKLRDSNEDSGEGEEFEDEDYYEPEERIVGRVRRRLDEDDDDYFEPRRFIGGRRKAIDEDSRERLMRKAIRDELRKFKRVESGEEIVATPLGSNKISPQSPLAYLLSLPIKFFSGVHDLNKQALPLVGSVPKIIVGTKKYFRDFGKNFKKNALHFASDIIGDFDHNGPTDNILGSIFNQRRHKRSINETKSEMDPSNSILGEKMEQYEPEYTLDFFNNDNTQNFRNASLNKVRKKRYVLKLVDDDEVEAILRKKLERLFDESEESYKPRKRQQRRQKFSDDTSSREILQSRRYARRKKYEDSEEDYKQKVVVEKVRPKVIIDNNGLPFMELDGYKRPIFLKNKRFKKKKMFESSEDQTLTNYDSSEEANLQKIHGVIDNARNYQVQSTRNGEMPVQTLKEKISQLLFETDSLVHMNFEKYDEIYDDLINIQQIKTSTVQDWKRLIMEKKINDRDAKIALLSKFQEMQRIKEIAVRNIIYGIYLDNDNKFLLKEFTKMLVRLQKLQCVVNQVVECFQQKFSMGTKFEMVKEIKFVDFLASTNFVYAKTRNDLIAKLKEARDNHLQANIQQLEKLKKMLVQNDENIIEEESNILWEMKNIEKMQTDNIEEMYQNLEAGCKIKKNLKILFDFSKRLQVLEAEERKLYAKCESQESSEDVEVSIEDKKTIKIETTPKKIDIDQFKKKWQDKMKKKKFLIEKNLKKTLVKLKFKDGQKDSDESE